MTADRIIGIDVGTTSVKAAVLGLNGQVHARFSTGYDTARSGANRVEQNPDDWIRLIRAALDDFADQPVAAIGLCSQVNTHVFVDAAGNALCPAISWQDGRAGPEAAELDAQISAAQKTAWWGAPMPIDASHAIARMAWMAKHRPDIWEKTRWVMLPKDYCLLKLTGVAATDPVSNIGLVDKDLRYIDDVLALVPGAADRLAPLVGITDVAGQVGDGPLAGCAVVAGTMDAWAGLVGTGAAQDRSTIYLSGTSEILGISSATVTPTPGVIVFPVAQSIRLHAAPTQNGGDAVAWFSQLTGLSMAAIEHHVATTPRSGATPLFLPQLDGERAPLWDADLRGAFLGVGRQTGMGDFARAVYEGVAFSARHALAPLQTSADVADGVISCGGGGFRAPTWAQIRADVLGRPLRTLAAGEPGVLGAAMLAAIGTGAFAGFHQAAALARYERHYHPDGEKTALYDRVFAIYKDAIAAHGDISKRLTRAVQDTEIPGGY
ncbi:xylulokinase [Oceaniglobus ichthyenteri]|uniref:xylulokinase n=1 Tax=Oceaniglobus ichthyenteri TaxID=2136177 RepID=UPI000D3A7D36|nr:FGGY family carbohydrate kinase [Oceaniglobus ichthyenteri]